MKKILGVFTVLILISSCSTDSQKDTSTDIVPQTQVERVEIVQDNEGEKTEEVGKSCSEEYEDLVLKYGQNYEQCYFQKPIAKDCDMADSEKPGINVVVIFDASGSMGNTIGGETMMDLAKEKVQDYIRDLDSDVQLSFLVYGHKGSGTEAGKAESCKGIEEIHSFGDTSTTQLLVKINQLTANGWTPITDSLIQAKEIIKKHALETDKNIILLISDGKETCGSDPVEEALNISKDLKNTYIDVIGFNVTGDTQKQLIDIAKNGGGSYLDVKSRADFENAFNKTKNFLDSMSCGANIAATELGYVMDGLNIYYACYSQAREEQTYIMVDATEKCKDEIQTMTEIDFEKRVSTFQNIKDDSMKILRNFDEQMQNIIDNMDR